MNDKIKEIIKISLEKAFDLGYFEAKGNDGTIELQYLFDDTFNQVVEEIDRKPINLDYDPL